MFGHNNLILLTVLFYSHYFIDSVPGYISLGCWKDTSTRAINNYEGKLGIADCYERAKTLGNEIFAIQYGSECWTTATAKDTYKKYGPAKGCCSEHGTGGRYCQEVYEIGTIDTEK